MSTLHVTSPPMILHKSNLLGGKGIPSSQISTVFTGKCFQMRAIYYNLHLQTGLLQASSQITRLQYAEIWSHESNINIVWQESILGLLL